VQLPAGLKVPRSPSSPAGTYFAAQGLTTERVHRWARDRASGGCSKIVSMTKLPLIPLTGSQYDLHAGDYAATVTELGAGIRQLSHRGRPVITGYEPDQLPPAGAGQLLAPWPNRIDHGQYAFAGSSLQLDLSEPAHGNAIHGLTRWTGWQAAAQADDSVTLRHVLHGGPGYPFCLELTASYRLDAETGLQVTVTARNAGSRDAPYGTGSHPYLTAGTPTIDECELELPASRWLPADERGIPHGQPQDVTGTPYDFREPHQISGTSVDHTLTGLARDSAGRAWARLASGDARLALWAGPGYDWLQVFSGDGLDPGHRRKALAIEPMTCPPNAFASGTGLLTLQPGDSVTHSWGIEVLLP
jgi:aldose 1-epimerase